MADYSKPDHWSVKARNEGYPARSVYKLKEMDEKFGLVRAGRPAFRAMDLGAAPGSWSLYVLRNLPAGTNVSLVSVDLAPLSRQYDAGLFDRPDFLFIQGDFTLGKVREELLACGPYSLILSDAAPATTGNRSLDTLRSLDLAETALGYAEAALAEGGNMAIKVFQGGEIGSLLKTMRGIFASARGYKPLACRSDSFETYYLGLGKKRGI